MKALAPVPFGPGQTTVQVPKDAEPVDVVPHGGGVVVLAQVNPITADAVPKVTWVVHGVRLGEVTDIPDKAGYAGATTIQLPDGQEVTIAAFVERNAVLLPGGAA